MRFPVILRALGDPWRLGETSDLSATGVFFVTERPLLLNTPIEYILTFPPELTKAPHPLRVRFFGTVLRCERVADSNGAFGVAVLKAAHRYLTREEAASFEALEQELSPTTSSANPGKSGSTGT